MTTSSTPQPAPWQLAIDRPAAAARSPGHRRGDAALALRLIIRAARYRWKLNPRQISAMLGLLPVGGVGLDVGAHKGAYSFWMGRRVGKSGRILAFEPQDRLVDDTARALWVVGLRQVRLLHCAVSDHSGEGKIFVRRGSTHGASVEGLDGAGEHGEMSGGGGGDVFEQPLSLLSLDDAAEREGLERVDFIKIDVEGHEMSVLRGAQRIVERFRPAILVEIEARHHTAGPDPIGAVRAMLAPLGYRGYFFDASGRRPIDEFRVEKHQRYGEGVYCNDFLFVQAGSA